MWVILGLHITAPQTRYGFRTYTHPPEKNFVCVLSKMIYFCFFSLPPSILICAVHETGFKPVLFFIHLRQFKFKKYQQVVNHPLRNAFQMQQARNSFLQQATSHHNQVRGHSLMTSHTYLSLRVGNFVNLVAH